MSLLTRTPLRLTVSSPLRSSTRGMVQGVRPPGPGPNHATVVTEHLPFSYTSKKAFIAKLGVFASAAFGLPFAAIYIHWHKRGGLKGA
ncbi:hypothetical protein Moror_5314 [Moniliophthora roreri MCA 2997]|uniref:Cytochrome c oxidase subunit 8, mitochondrial n=2 Tax=Moniliophthora roreri TaxID=221103 RepID=V2X8G3_MONRO|nr:hypothetical protein Moror_5314 [Moniliophthora roreri MCA 2997]KAI3595090.1 hypothetical protein WG66_001085 [Moniliophthora roreri]